MSKITQKSLLYYKKEVSLLSNCKKEKPNRKWKRLINWTRRF